MSRSAAQVIENNFVRALVTEATGLNYPENSCIETWDCEFDFFGRVARRLAFDTEFGFIGKTIDKTASAINRYHWKNVTGDGLISLVVIQIGGTLYFYDSANASALSAGALATTITLGTFSPGGAPAPSLYDCQFADGLGKLYVFHPYLNNFYVTYNAAAGTVSGTQYSLNVRDFEGASADALAVDDRPTSTYAALTDAHKYNLFNQGWIKANGQIPELQAWDAARADMPSNCDVWWNFKNATDAFDTATIINSGRGSSPAPKGHFVLNAYNMDRTAFGTVVTATTSGVSRSSTGAFHAGRVFYAGVNATGYTSKIYFSQIIERDNQIGACYQVADPTSEDIFDLLPADGGVISIPEAGTIYKLFSMANGLLVLAYRGVWMITGSVGIGFTATDFTVTRLSNIRTVSASSFVDVNGVPMWWNTDGIFTAQGGQGTAPQVQSMSISTIQSFFNEIPNTSKGVAKGYFNPLAQTVQWLFSTVEPSTIEDTYTFNAVLNFNVLTSAFFPWTIGPGLQVHDLVVVDGTGGQLIENLVVDNTAAQVVNDAGINVAAYSFTNTSILPLTKFLVSYVESGITKFTWAEASRSNYLDWSSFGLNVDYLSYFITGYKTHGQAQTKFQPTYVYVYNEGLGSAYIQGIWDFALSSSTGRYSTKQLLTYDDPNYSNNHRRVKIRGQGLTLQYFVHSLSGQPFNMIGWSTFETGNQAI